MIIEFLIGASWVTICGMVAYGRLQDINSPDKLPSLKQELVKPELSDAAALIVETFNTDDPAWKFEIINNAGTNVKWTNEPLELVILRHFYTQTNRFSSIVNMAGETLALSETDKKAIQDAISAYSTRAADRKQKQLARALAERIVARGEVRPVLGAPGISEPDPAKIPRMESGESDDSNLSTGFYEYSNGQLIRVGPEGARADVGTALAERYGLKKTIIQDNCTIYTNGSTWNHSYMRPTR